MNPVIEILRQSFGVLQHAAVGFLPSFIAAIALVVFGFIVGISFGKVIQGIIRVLKVDELLEGTGIRGFLLRGGVRLDTGLFFGGLVKWFIIMVFLTAGLQAVGLTQVNIFLQTVVLSYTPQIIIATLMLSVAAVGARVIKIVITAFAKSLNIPAAHFLGTLASLSLWVGTIIFVLSQLGIPADFIKILFIGVVSMFSLAFGLAFGLGGREEVALLLSRMRKDADNHHHS